MKSNNFNSNKVFINPPIWSNLWYQRKELYKQIKKINGLYLSPLSGLNILDFGCGIKPYKDIFNGTNNSYIGADLSINPYAEIKFNEGESLPLNDNSFDVILSSQVLEHVIKPEDYLEECSRLLKPGGYLIISTHGHFIYHPVPNDYWRWTIEGLRVLLTNHKFEILEVRGIMNVASTGLQFIQDSLRPHLFKILQVPFTIIFQILIFLSDKIKRIDKDKDSSIFLIIAKLNA